MKKKYFTEEERKEAQRKYSRKYRKVNKERIAEQRRRHRETHKEELREKKHQYYEANKERFAERNREYRKANKEQLAEYMRRYYNTPLGKAKAMVNTFRREDSKYNRGECTITEDWIMKNIFTSKCHYCGETNWKKLSCDRIDNDLPHTPKNIVCSCWDCNNKRNTMPFDEFVTKCKEAGEIVTNRNDPKKSKPVIAIDDEGSVVCEFPSTREAGRNGYNQSAVAKACNGCFGSKKNSHRYKGLLWFWA